jgi:hypothetical protein
MEGRIEGTLQSPNSPSQFSQTGDRRPSLLPPPSSDLWGPQNAKRSLGPFPPSTRATHTRKPP